MLAALLTSLLFAFSGVAGNRSAAHFRPLDANCYRLGIAFVLLAATWWFLGGKGWDAEVAWWLLWSGVIGFGFGDIALYLSYSRLGSRLTILTVFSTAPAVAAAGEWVWLGVGLSWIELIAMVVVGIGLGVVFWRAPSGERFAGQGLFFALLAGIGQGVGAVLSRKANLMGEVQEGFAGGLGQALLRVTAGGVIALAALLLVSWRARAKGDRSGRPPLSSLRPKAWFALVAAGLAGPLLGVSCFQWALLELPSGITLAIVASSPLLIVPLAWWIEGDRPSARALLGTFVAVGGVAWLCLLRG